MTFAEIALAVVGAAVVVLALTAAAVALLPVSPRARAGIAILGIAGTLSIMSVVSTRMSDRAVRAEYGTGDDPLLDDPPGNPPPTDRDPHAPPPERA